jgi:Glycosyl transferase family 2
MLVRDDNDILPEWLAYHYHTLRMRRLIVAVDPHSETSPSAVLDPWKDLMEIDIWTDDMYMDKAFLDTGMPPKKHFEQITKFGAISEEQNLAINAHRYRQKYFLGQCFQQFQKEGRALTMHIDTDEYIVPSKYNKSTAAHSASFLYHSHSPIPSFYNRQTSS